LWRSEGLIFAITGGLLGQTELVRDFFDACERRTEDLLAAERAKLEDE